MSLNSTHSVLPLHLFIKRLFRNTILGVFITIISLFGGMAGYRHFEKMSWVDAYVNAAMILSGMGPTKELETDAGKIFAGTYALFSGIIFLVIMAIVFAPVIHWFFHKFHLEEANIK